MLRAVRAATRLRPPPPSALCPTRPLCVPPSAGQRRAHGYDSQDRTIRKQVSLLYKYSNDFHRDRIVQREVEWRRRNKQAAHSQKPQAQGRAEVVHYRDGLPVGRGGAAGAAAPARVFDV
eukprot:TRINITY_DN11291_c0_g2_i1.p3 TRINITY_DN11291_c0_g2~~TRINITY_DN11291_c0_g2_i1.p3  ORF type:complete len:120 (+),score=29.81 TRINITY_DN11291_c0_g2_i1:184-543(+)